MPPPSNVALRALDDDAGQGIGLSIPRLRSADACALSLEMPAPASSGDVIPMPPDVVTPDCAEQGAVPGAMVASINAVRKSLVRTKASSARLPPVNNAAAMQRATRKDDPPVWNKVTRAAGAPASTRPARTAAAGTVQGADAGSAGTDICLGGIAGAASEPSAWAAR